MSQSDDQGRSEPSPYGQATGGDPYGQPQQYGQPADPFAKEQSGQPQYGQPQYGQPQYGQPQYGQQQGAPAAYGEQYGQPQQYGQPGGYPQQYGQGYGQYGTSATAAKPPHVITAAVLGFIFGAFGVLFTLVAFVGGAALVSVSDAFEGTEAEDAAGIGGALIVVVGLLILAWTVAMIWGSVWALSGRSRVMLLVGGSIALALTLFGFLGSLGDGTTGGGGIVFNLLLVVAALAIVVLLCLKPSADFFAAKRAQRGR
jgi:hypothetical protein